MKMTTQCLLCEELFAPKRLAKYCSNKCRSQAAYERNRSPIRVLFKAISVAEAWPALSDCPICKDTKGFTDSSLAVCSNGHQWSIKGEWQEGYNRNSIEVYKLLSKRFCRQLRGE